MSCDLLIELMDAMASSGIDASFDTYPYRRGCTLLSMPLLPAALLAGPNSDVAATLRDPKVRADLLANWFPSLETNPEMGFARDVADRVILMDGGEIVEDSRPDANFTNPRQERTRVFFRRLLDR